MLEEEMSLHLQASRREAPLHKRGMRNGYHKRDMVIPVGKVEQLRVPRARRASSATKALTAIRA